MTDEDNNILILKRSETDNRRPLQWDLPGGRVDAGEELLSAAVRETQEETGIDIRQSGLTLLYSMCDYDKTIGNLNWLFFGTTVNKQEVKLSSEHIEAKWLPIDEAIKEIFYQRQIDVLEYIRKHHLI